jgi:hypothetical protein
MIDGQSETELFIPTHLLSYLLTHLTLGYLKVVFTKYHKLHARYWLRRGSRKQPLGWHCCMKFQPLTVWTCTPRYPADPLTILQGLG